MVSPPVRTDEFDHLQSVRREVERHSVLAAPQPEALRLQDVELALPVEPTFGRTARHRLQLHEGTVVDHQAVAPEVAEVHVDYPFSGGEEVPEALLVAEGHVPAVGAVGAELVDVAGQVDVLSLELPDGVAELGDGVGHDAPSV